LGKKEGGRETLQTKRRRKIPEARKKSANAPNEGKKQTVGYKGLKRATNKIPVIFHKNGHK